MVNISSKDVAEIQGGRKRRVGGASQRAGSNFQKAVVQSAAFYSGWVKLEELPPVGGRYVGKGKFVRQKMPCDFVGSIRPQGGAIFFDAKCIGHRSSLACNNPKVVEPHQIDFLSAMESAGALAGFLIECKTTRGYYWLAAHHAVLRKIISINDNRMLALGPTTKCVDFESLVRWFTGS